MATTILGLKFKINDLSARYEVIGTSDNYSFSYDLGKGEDLVESSIDNQYTKSIDLLGNYGIFNVRVFAETSLGIRSQFIEDTVVISPPSFGGTYTFSKIQMSSLGKDFDPFINKAASQQDNLLNCSSVFAGRHVNIKWEVSPPPGHPLEGQSISSELMSDPFFDHFELSLKSGNPGLDISSLSSSEPLMNTLKTEEVNEALSNYRENFLNIDNYIFEDLDLARNLDLQIVCVDSLGDTCTGLISGFNPAPVLSSFSNSTSSSKTSFSWSSEDFDFRNVQVSYLAVPHGYSIYDDQDLQNSILHLESLSAAKEYIALPDFSYQVGDLALYSDDNVYRATQDHIVNSLNGPGDLNFWEEVGPKVNFHSDTETVNLNFFENVQLWGFNYYYSLLPFDEFGAGDVFNVTSEGLSRKGEGGELRSFNTSVAIGDLNFRERGDDLVFSWGFFDEKGNKLDLTDYRVKSDSIDASEQLFVQAYIFDVDTLDVVYDIDPLDPSIFDYFEYNRDLNNSIYLQGGFPPYAQEFDPDQVYSPDGSNNCAFIEGQYKIFKSVAQNSFTSPYVRPYYKDWVSENNYYSVSDENIVKYDGALYKVIQDIGPLAPSVVGFFNEEFLSENSEYYSIGDLVFAPDIDIEIFNPSLSFNVGGLVFYRGSVYRCLSSQSKGNAIYPNLDSEFWRKENPVEDFSCSVFKLIYDSSIEPMGVSPASVNSGWERVTPNNNSDYFSLFAGPFNYNVVEWSEDYDFYEGDFTVYGNDIWICLAPNRSQRPPEYSSSWSNQIFSSDSNSFQDIVADYKFEDIVFHNDQVYKCLSDNPTGAPISAISEPNRSSLSNYLDSQWIPFWEEDLSDYGNVFGHVGIPESGKRDIGIDVSLVNLNGDILDSSRIIATNPPPRILPQGFSVDSTSMASRVRFNFNYDQGFQEKTTKVNLYRSSFPDFDITGSDKFPLEHIGADSTFVKSVLGAGDATFGDNITEIFDDPPLYVNSEGIEEATGYYYKILPFDDFGSGDLFGVNPSNDGGLDKIIVYPKNFHSQNPTDPIGEIPKASQPNLGPDGGIILYESIPGPAQNLTGDTAFVNYFLNWDMPTSERDENDNFVKRVPNDIDYYEIWESTGKYINYSLDGGVSSSFLNQTTNLSGYRRIIGDLESYGDVPLPAIDIAESIVGSKNIFDVDARSLSLETTYKGEVNDRRYFWVRPVDFAGNKGPFTGAKNFDGEYVEGLELTLGQAKTTDIADFEQNITKTFPNTVALVPNNPFKNQDPNSSSISWESHYLYNNGTGYYISAGSTDDKFLYFTGSSLELTEDQKKEELKLGQAGGGTLDDSKNNPLRNVVFTGDYDSVDYHPAGQGQGTDNELPAVVDDSDFIIARNVNGVASPMWHAFANALIGSAHIENAAITNAKIHNLTADKIRSAEIKGQDIQVGLGGGSGQIRSAGFDGLADTGKGFVVSGDGSFVFAADDGRLHFDDGELILEGKFKTVDGKEYTFIDLDASPDSFFYSELSDGTYVSDGPQTCEIRASFQNSFVQENQVRFRVSNPNNGYEFIKYSDFNDNPASATYGKYNISGFKYDPTNGDFVGGEPKVATAEFNVTGFNQMINTVDSQLTTIIVSASGLNTSTERSIPINFVADGAAAVYVELAATQQVFEYDSDGNELATNSDPTLTATAYNADGLIYYNFISGGLSLQNSESNSYQVTGIPEKFEDMPIAFSVDISGQDDSAILASDRFTFFGTHPGKDSYTVFLTNENHTYPAQENGQITSSQDLVNGGTEIKFFRGTSEYTYSDVGGVRTFSTGEIISSDPSNVEVFIDRSTADKPIIQLSKYEKESNEGTLTIPIYDNQYYPDVEFSKTYTFSKTKEGAKGRQLELTAPDQTIEYNSQGSLIGPNSVTITANTENFFDANPEFEFYSGDFSNSNIIQSGVGNTYTHDDIPGSYDSDHIPVTILCKAFDSLDGTKFEEKARDQITIFGIKEGANAITFVQSQEFANVPVANSSSGDVDTPDFSSTTNEIKVFEGIKELTCGGFDTSPGNTKEKFYINSVKVKNASDDLEISSAYIDKTDPTSGSPSTTINVWNDLTITNVYLEYSITVVNHEGLAEDFSIRQNVTLTFDGTIARKVDLTADQQSVTYDTAGSSILSPSTNNGRIKLTATDKNTGSTVKFKFAEEGSFSGQLKLEDGTTYDSSEWSDENEVYYHPPSSRSSFNSDTIKVEISENENNVLASDVLTIYAIQDGSDVITAILSNEAHSLTKDFEGIITSTGSGTDIKVFQGAEELTFVTGTGNPSGENTFTVAIAGSLPTGVTGGSRTTPSNKKHCNVAEYNFSSFTGQSATITYTITFKNDVGETGTITKQQTFSISQEGEHARKVDLTGDQAVKYNTAGSSPDPDEITLTATALNQRPSSTLQYRYSFVENQIGIGALKQGNSTYNGDPTNENTIKYNPPDNKFKVATVMVEMIEDGNDVAKDTLSIYGIQDGSDVITAILSNEAHSFTADSDGNVSDYGGGQTSIQVFQGATELNFSIADVGNDASKYNVAKTEGGINAGNLEQHSNGCRTPSVSNMAGNSAFIDFTITGRNDEGIEFGPINKVQTFSKSIAGEGEIGNRGVGVVFRGLWESDKIYIGATETSDRGDVVFYDDGNQSSFKYWIAQEDHTSVDFASDKLAGKWESFGAEFESVATDLLLSKDAVITHTLTMGQGDINGGNEYVGHGGLIKTVGKEFGNGVTGFFLGNTGNPPNPQFDVGGESSFIRFDGDSDRVEIKGSLIINSRDNNNLNKNSIDGEDATFIGGGYNNSISGLGSSIVGGGENDISGRFSFIGGGFNNNMGDNFSAIVAGYNNEMPNTGELHQGANLIGAGIHNIIDGGTSQTIVNGSENLIQQTGNVGDELVAFDGQQGWLSPGFLGTFSGYGGGGFAYNKSANFVDGLAGWVENSWWPSYKKDWGVNTLSNVFYIGTNRGISQSAWVYHTDLKWCLFPDQSSEMYNDAEYRIYNSLYGKAYPNKDAFYVFMAGFDPDFQGFYFWYKDEGLSLAQSGGSLGLGIRLYRHILPAAYDATTTYVAGELAADPGDGKYYKSTNGVAAGGGTPSSTAGWTVADSSDISSYGWYFLKKDNNSEIKLYHSNTQQWHSPISVP